MIKSRFGFVIGLSALGWLGAAPRAVAECSQDDRCTGGPARVMLILDASSDQLNGGNSAAPQGMSDWDTFRRVLADPVASLYDAQIASNGIVASQVIHFGVIVFGDASPAPGEQKRVIDYGPCTRSNVEWALDPRTSCTEPGCSDPWGGPPITWTFVDGSDVDPPNFAVETVSHMPRCDSGAGNGCNGSGRFVHLGLELARQNRLSHPDRTPYTHDGSTQYVDILLIHGTHDSSSEQVQGALERAFEEGVVTRIVGYPGAQTSTPGFLQELDEMAAWGSGGTLPAYPVVNEAELRAALADILSSASLPCCRTIDCSPVGGADDGGADGGDGGDGGAATWGSAGGSGSASASDGNDDSSCARDAPVCGDAIDDDGGCRCGLGSGTHPLAAWLSVVFLALGWRRASRKRAR